MKNLSAIITIILFCLIPVVSLAAPQWSERKWHDENIKAMEKLLKENSMQDWAGAMPMNTIDDIKAYMDTFYEWGKLFTYISDHNLKGSLSNKFKKQVQAIQVAAFPKLRQAMVNIAMQSSGFDLKNIQMNFTSPDYTSVEFIWTGQFSPPANFVSNIHRIMRKYDESLRFAYITYYKAGSTGKIRIKKYSVGFFYSTYANPDSKQSLYRDKDIIVDYVDKQEAVVIR